MENEFKLFSWQVWYGDADFVLVLCRMPLKTDFTERVANKSGNGVLLFMVMELILPVGYRVHNEPGSFPDDFRDCIHWFPFCFTSFKLDTGIIRKQLAHTSKK